MSYIRDNENPEGLYVWGDGEDLSFCVNGRIEKISRDLFYKVVTRWHNDDFDALIDEESVTEDGLQVVSRFRNGKLEINLRHRNWSLSMWPVTWEYLVNEVVAREKR